jgi:hypothetical protein
MYCNFCGSSLSSNQAVCGKCGNAIVGRHMLLSRVEQHFRLVGSLWIAVAILLALGGFALFIIAHTIFGRFNEDHPAFLHPLLTGIACFILIKAIASLIAGIGLLERQTWARPLVLVLAFIALFNIPFGTALGVYTLWVFMSPHADAEYQRLAASAG